MVALMVTNMYPPYLFMGKDTSQKRAESLEDGSRDTTYSEENFYSVSRDRMKK